MINITDRIKRNIIWISLVIIPLIFFTPKIQEINTIFFIILIEVLAIILSSFAAYVFTKLDFTKDRTNILGFIFLGVHLCVGLSVLGTYIVQF